MKIKVLDKTAEFPNDLNQLDNILHFIQSEARMNAMEISHLTVDQQEIYDDYASFISNNIQNIGMIEVQLVTEEQRCADLISMLISYLHDALPAIKGFYTSIYNGMNQSTWNQLAEFLEGMQWIMFVLLQLKKVDTGLERFEAYLAEQILQLNDALEKQDYTLVADIIQYEITPVLEQLRDHCS